MNLNQFYYFNELVKQHQFSRAAQLLQISQPSLSNSIKKLEKELNCDLIVRKNGRTELTNYGQIFYEASTSIVATFEKAKHDIKQAQRGENNTIELGCIPTASEFFLPHFINAFKEQCSRPIHYLYHDTLPKHICQELQNENYDIGICTKVDNYPDLIFIPLYIEDTIFTAKQDSNLAAKLVLPKNTRIIYLVYNSKAKLSPSTQELINFVTK